MKALLLPLCLVSSVTCADMTANDAFNEGNTFGKANVGTAKSKISTTTASDANTGVPNYTATDPASSYYMGGTGSLTAPATAGVTGCTSTAGTADPDPHTHGKCEGVRMLMNDPGKKNVMFPLNSTTDPLVVKRNMVSGDAETYLGSLIVSGGYAGCAEKTVKDPDKYQTETCDQYLTAGEESCNEVLTVTVTTSESCIPGTWYGGYMMGIAPYGWLNQIDIHCDMTRTDGKLRLRFTPVGLHGVCSIGYLDVPKSPFTVADSVGWGVIGQTCDGDGNCSDSYGPVNYELTSVHNWKGACTVTNYIGYEPGYAQGCVGDTCNFTFRALDSRWGNQAVATGGPFTPPKTIVTETDFWDNQCMALEARLP